MDNLDKKAEITSTVAIVIMAIAVTVFLINRTYLNPPNSDSRAGFKAISAGTKVSLPDTDWNKSENTLLLVVAKGCHFCSESAQFYQRLASEVSARKNVQIIALLPQKEDEGRRYFGDLKVPIADIRQAPLDSLGIVGMPTLILVNSSGVATKVWAGQLQQDQEDEVFSAIQGGTASLEAKSDSKPKEIKRGLCR